MQEIEDRWNDGLTLHPPSIGVFPFDQDVVMKATKTYLSKRSGNCSSGGEESSEFILRSIKTSEQRALTHLLIPAN